MPESTQQQDPDNGAGRPSGNESKQDKRREGGGTSPLEWAVAAVSALLVLAVMAIMLYEAISEPSTPPQIEITVVDVMEVAGGYLVQFQAHNKGQETASGLVVEGALKSGSETVETSSVTIDYVPSESKRSAGLYFSHDPDSLTLEMSPEGFDRP